MLNSKSAQLVKFEKQIQQLNAKVAPRIKYHLQQDASNVKSKRLPVEINASRVNRLKLFSPRHLACGYAKRVLKMKLFPMVNALVVLTARFETVGDYDAF